MDSTLWILIYSKFSPACNDLFSLIKHFSIQTPFKLLEIDNKDIRKKILSDKQFSIKTVPCIISLTSTGVASQYEGPKAFELIHAMKPEVLEIKQEIKPEFKPVENRRMPVVQLQDMQPKIRLEEPEPIVEKPSTNAKENSVTLIEDLIDVSEQNVSPPTEDVVQSQVTKSERSVSNAIKGEKISVSSVLSQAQKAELNPRNSTNPRPDQKEREEPPKQTGAKVNISSIMSSART